MDELASYAGKEIRFNAVANTEEAITLDNIRATFARGYIRFNELLNSAKGRTISIVGSGPSLSWTYKDIVGDIIACNSAHDFLIEKGIVPKYAMYWDANPIIAEFAKKPHEGVIYLVASRCHPDLFKALEKQRVIVFHALSGENIAQFLVSLNRMEPMIGGGCAGVTRATHIAGAMGYTDMHLFGADSSYSENDTHVGVSIINQQKMKLRVCGKEFITAPWMALQVADFKKLGPHLQKGGVKFTVHGRGMFQHAATFIEGVATPDIRVGLLEKAKRKVHGLIVIYLGLRGDRRYAEHMA